MNLLFLFKPNFIFVAVVLLLFTFPNSKEKNQTDSLLLFNTQWCLIQIEQTNVLCDSFTERSPHLVLNSEGFVLGNSGCNQFRGGFKFADSNQISFGVMAGTRMMCKDMSVENRFFKILDSVQAYQLNENADTLQMNDRLGRVLIKWKAVKK